MANKSRILFLLKYLQQHSDEEHSMTTADLRTAGFSQIPASILYRFRRRCGAAVFVC